MSELPIDPFGAAKRCTGISVSFDIELVLAICPTWTLEQAQNFLHRHGSVIAHTMIWSGEQAVRHLIQQKDEC
ncbi:MAG TPA: hypothetical protein VGG19_14900 [Tepidisphaeraceae bacterium]